MPKTRAAIASQIIVHCELLLPGIVPERVLKGLTATFLFWLCVNERRVLADLLL